MRFFEARCRTSLPPLTPCLAFSISMAKTKNTAPTTTEQTAPVLVRKIGKTTYMVGIHFSQTSKETMDDKVLRLIKNDIRNAAMCG